MNSSEARRILEVWRPNGADAADPAFREALAQVDRDPELARWFSEQRSFDEEIVSSFKAVAVPVNLRESVLAARQRIVRPPVSWWRPAWNDWRLRAAAAAAVVLLATLAGAFAQRGPSKFADFRKEMILEGWGGTNHLAFRSSDLIRIKQWLAGNGGPTAFVLPAELRNHRLHGCNAIQIGGHGVAVLCLADGPKHLHLFVAEDVQFADLPRVGEPDFERCGIWKTTAWRDGGRTFVLTGMSYHSFVNTFRKSGRWTMSG